MYLQYFLLHPKKEHLLPKIPHNQLNKKKKDKEIYQQIYRVTAHDILTNKSNEYNSTTYRKSLWKDILQKQADIRKKPLAKSVARTTTYIQSNPMRDTKSKTTINGYKFIKQIGNGGFAKVYQATYEQQNAILSPTFEKKSFAVKQYSIDTAKQCYQNQYNVGKTFFSEDGNLKQKFQGVQGSNHIIKFIEKFRFGKKCYIVQELGGHNLSKLMSDIQGVFYQNQRVYEVNFKPFYTENLINKNQLAKVFLQLCKGIQLLHSQGFIHCDLKSQNVLVDVSTDNPQCKIIDFGSTFQLSQGVPKVTITPEYMPPQLLNYLHSDMLGNIVEQKQKVNCTNWNENGFGKGNRLDRIDIWSLGCILLEIVTGVPLWFKYKCKIMIKGKPNLQLSYFSMSNRQYPKLMKKQKQLSKDIKKINFTANQFEKFRPILKKCLEYDPQVRIGIDELVRQVQRLL